MKAFLTSHYLAQVHFDAFTELLGKPKASEALFITAAAVPYGLDSRPTWLTESLTDMSKLTEDFEETSLEEDDDIPDDLSKYDFIFVSGGNVFYLAYRLRETGFDTKLKKYIEKGGVYAGSSAGAIILMDNIEGFAPADEPEKAPKIYPGLDLVDFALIPHADHEKYAPLMKGIAKEYEKEGKEIVSINDNQVVVVDEGKRAII